MENYKFFEPLLSTHRNSKLNEYRKIAKFTDLTLRSTDGKTMTVHKSILAAVCPYFEGMFNSDLVRQEVIQLVDDVTFAELEILIEYIYTGKAKVTVENAKNLFCKAQYFQLTELEQFCTTVLINNITVENCLGYSRHSGSYFNHKLTDECLKFMKTNCKSFLEFNCMDLTVKEFKCILSKEMLEINEEDLYKFVVKWIKADIDTRSSHLMELIKNFDFINFSDEFIETEIMTDEILQTNREFTNKMVRIMFQKLRHIKRQIKLKYNSAIIDLKCLDPDVGPSSIFYGK